MTGPRATPAVVARSLLFALWVYGLGAVLGIGCLPVLLGPRRWAVAAIRFWSRLVMAGLKGIVGARIEVRGRANLPSGPCLIAAKHQGMFDIVPPFDYLSDPAFVLKRELMRIPIFGWYAARAGMIVIDREGGATTLRALVRDARAAFAEGRQVIIFPEGTRRAPGAEPDYKPGIAGLYRELGVPCAPLAANSGLVWPAHGVLRYPGKAVFEFLPPIPAGLKRAAFMKALQDAVETASARLLTES